jgi:hypothetical protein
LKITEPSIHVENEAESAAASSPFVGRWNTLVSTTNWEKGRIISEWRETLRESGAASSEWSDEAWSRLVGGVTGQHAGRLRRVFQRFGAVYSGYKGLYWSHFHAAIDWDDAEMWLEGAVQNGWSVASMQDQRWSVLAPGETPVIEDAVASELDEDFEPALREPVHSSHDEEGSAVKSADQSGDEEFDEEEDDGDDYDAEPDSEAKIAPVKPFQDLAELPPDLHDAFESFKLAILRHKAIAWSDIALDDVLAALDSLKALATAP